MFVKDRLIGPMGWVFFTSLVDKNSREAMLLRLCLGSELGFVFFVGFMRDITDGTSNTIGLGERASMFAPNTWAGVVPGANTVFSPQIASQRNQVVGATRRPAITMTAVHVRSGGPTSPTGSPGGFWSPHRGGAHFALMDGSTQFISTNVDIVIFRLMAARNDGQVFSLPD